MDRIKAAPEGTQIVGFTKKELDHLEEEVGTSTRYAPSPEKEQLVSVHKKLLSLLDSLSEGNESMNQQLRKMSEIMKEMSETLLRDPDAARSSESAHVALMFANIAWNETVGLGHAREGYRSAWEVIEAENPEMWSEFKSTDVDAMLDELVAFKKKHYPHDLRRILTCGIPEGSIRVEWLKPAAPGVDSQWEMTLYGLVRTGAIDEAIRFLRKTRTMSRKEAEWKIASVAAELGMV